MTRLSDTTETYLRTIFNIDEDGVAVRKIRLAERLGQAGPTVSQTVGRLERNGYVWVSAGQEVQLTPRGRAIAIVVTRRHRLAERMLVDVLGIPATAAHDEADRWEHALSEASERSIVSLLDDPALSPWGNPIPGLDTLGVRLPGPKEYPRLADIAPSDTRLSATVRSISEEAQDDPELITAFTGAGIIPGAPIEISAAAGDFILRGLSQYVLPRKRAHLLRVEFPATGRPTGASGPV